MITRIAAAALAAAGIAAGVPPVTASAAPDPDLGPNCDTVLWGFLGSQRRTLCDGPLRPDGSWDRKRSIWTPAHTNPLHTSCSGTTFVTCTTWGGNFVPFTINDQQTYPFTPDTVLPDEPGHLG